jgi:hypothetical protein
MITPLIAQVIEAVPTVPIHASPSESNHLLWGAVITSSFALLTTIVSVIRDAVKRHQDRADAELKRVQDRADRALELEQLQRSGRERERNILTEVREVKSEAKKAFDTANGHNEKIAKMGENITKAIETPSKVIVVNPPDQPVHTTKSLEVPNGSPGEGA